MTTRTATTGTQPKTKSMTSKAPSRTADAVVLLKADHRKVEGLFSEFEAAKRSDQKGRIVKQICSELTVHATLEEKDFYPAAQEALKNDDQDLVAEARVEHATLKWLIAQLENAAPDADLYEAKVTVLKEYVQHHVKEEEKEMFPKLKKTELDLKALGAKLATSKEKIMQDMKTH